MKGDVRVAIAGVSLAVGIGIGLAQLRSGIRLTTYGSVLRTAMALDLAAGWLLLAGGVGAWWSWREPRAGLLAIAAAFAWFGPDLLGRPELPAVVRAIGMVIAPMVLPLIAGVTVVMTGGSAQRRPRRAVGGLLVLMLMVSLGRTMTYAPATDPGCWASCLGNALLVSPSSPITAALNGVELLLTMGSGLGLAAWATVRLARGGRWGRTWDGWVLMPAIAVGLVLAVSALWLLATGRERPIDPAFVVLFHARALTVTAFGAGLTWLVGVAAARTAAVRRLAVDIGEADVPAALRTALRRAIGDQSVSVVYWLADVGRYVDEEGREVDPPARSASRSVASIERAGEPIAVIGYDAAVAAPDLEDAIGTAARLAADNERLRAAVLWQLRELQESRARIVAAGDAERRRLERNLHDGVQQRLLALASDLALLGIEADRAGAMELADRMRQADRISDLALDDLRELAQGIYPAILGEAGLHPALASLARDAALPVEITGDTGGRCAATVETAAYHLVSEAIGLARRAGATFAAVRVDRAGDRLVVETRDDGTIAYGPLTRLRDRIGAVGGSLEASEATSTEARWIRAELPCGS